MKCNKQKDLRICYGLAFSLALLLASVAQAQTTVFSYQGRLTDAGNPANGNYDLQYKLFDALSGGTQQGSTAVRHPVAVSAGVFNVTLDFGQTFFAARAPRFLEIGVRPAGSVNPYTVLSPRQPVNSTRYAIQALNAQQLGGVEATSFLTTGAAETNFIRNTTTTQANTNFNISGSGTIGGNLGVGITPALGRLHAHSSGATSHLVLSTGSGSEGPARFRLQADSGLGGQGRSFVIVDDLAAQYRMVINGSGNVGLGLTTPAAKLHVTTTGNNNVGIRADSQGNSIIGVSTTPGYATILAKTRLPAALVCMAKLPATGQA